MEQEIKIKMRDGRTLELPEFIEEVKKLHKAKVLAGGGGAMGKVGFADQCISELMANGGARAGVKFKGRFSVDCYSPIELETGDKVHMKYFQEIVEHGYSEEGSQYDIPRSSIINRLDQEGLGTDEQNLESILASHHKWEDTFQNLVVDQGMNHILDALFSSEASVSPWWVGLTDGATVTVAVGDTMASHSGWTEKTDYTGNRKAFVDVRSSQTVTNSASKASFAINATVTIGGAFLTSDETGTAGKLLCAGAFTGGDRAVVSGDTLNVTYTFTAADDGV